MSADAGSPEPLTAGGRPSARSATPLPDAGPRHWLPAAIARGLAFFIGGFTLLGVVGAARGDTFADFDANVWWVVVPYAGRVAGTVLLAAVGVAFVAYAAAPRMRPWRRWISVGLFLFFAAAAVYNAVAFYQSWRGGRIEPSVPLPLSLVVVLLLAFVAWGAVRDPAHRGLPAAAVIVLVAGLCVALFPLAQVLFFGTTDYRREASIAVVFGAQVHADGAPSTSLRDRVATAVELYKERLVRRILVSGGVGDSGYNEALVMRDMAVAAGVPEARVIVDSSGVNTEATVRHSLPFLAADASSGVLAVSQFYHLPRIKLAYARAGWDVLTVPAGSSTRISNLPFTVLREVPAFWLYYVRAIFA